MRSGLRGVLFERHPWGRGLQILVARDPNRAQFRRGFTHVHRIHEALVSANARGEFRDQRLFALAPCAALWHNFAEFGAAEFGDARDEIAQNVGEIFVHRGLEILPSKFAIAALRRVAEQPPAPIIGWQDFKRLIHKHAASARCRELAAIVIEVVQAFDIIDQLPRLTGAQNGYREAKRMERHVIFAHELRVAHIVSA